jgi:drug/metabolite transporter (DMT)-like permease
MVNLKAGRFALPAGIFATMLWGSQAWVAVRAMPQLNFLEITLLLHAFALAGITTLNLFRLRDFVRDLKFLLRVGHALAFWILSGACQGVCFLLFYLSVQNGPQIPGMIMHFMWPFIFAIANALFPSTWKQHSSGYELKVVAIGSFGVWFLMQSGLAVGEHSALGLGKAALMLAGLASALFGGANAVFDYHAIARSRARHVELLQAPELPVTFRYSALQIRFLSGLVAMLLLCFGLQATPLLLPPLYFGDLSVQDLIAPFWLGFVVYFGADFFFDYTMTHVSESARQGFTYLPPLFGAFFLYLGGARIDQQMVFGVLIILLAMFQMQAGTRDWTANTAAPFLFIFASIIVLQVPDMLRLRGALGDAEGVNAEVMAGVFAIVISFLLSRLLERNKSENELEIENVNIMGEIIAEADRTLADKSMLLKLKNLAYRLSVYILDFDVTTARSRRSFLIHKINAVVQGMGRVLRESYPDLPAELKGRYEDLDRGISKWIFLRSQFLSLSEKWSVALLSFASVIAFLVASNRTPIWYADLSAIALITTVFILVFQAFDLGANRSEAEVADILNKQMPLLRHGFLPYVPFELIQKRVFVTDTRPLAVLTRRPDGAYEHAYLPTRENDLRFLAQLLNASGLTAVLLLLLNKHGIVNLWY